MILGANVTVDIYRMQYNASTNTYPGSPNSSGLEAYIESQRMEIGQVLDQGLNLDTYVMYIDPVTINIGDKVVDSSGVEYRVSGVERHENNPDTDDVYVVQLNKQHNISN